MKRVVLSALMILIAAPSFAQEDSDSSNGFYIGGGVGALRIDTSLTDTGLSTTGVPSDSIAPGEIESDDFRKSSIANKLFIGFRAFDYFGIEASIFGAHNVDERYCFIDSSGECEESSFFPPPSVGISRAWSVEMPTSGYTVALTGFWPINDSFEVMVKVGGVYMDVDGEARERVIGGLIPTEFPDGSPRLPFTLLNEPVDIEIVDDWDAMGAIGVNFNSESGFGVRAELEYFSVSEIDEPWLATMSVLYSF